MSQQWILEDYGIPANYNLPQMTEATQRMTLPLWPVLHVEELYCVRSECSHQLRPQE